MKKGDIEFDTLIEWLIVLGVLVIILFGGYLVISGKIFGIIEYIKNLFRFRG